VFDVVVDMSERLYDMVGAVTAVLLHNVQVVALVHLWTTHVVLVSKATYICWLLVLNLRLMKHQIT
jgi:hypothetical protein